MTEYNGWLFDLYAGPEKGIVLWLVGEDGKPHCLYHDLVTTFYIRGSSEQLREAGLFLRSKYPPETVAFERAEKEELFDGPQVVLGVKITNPADFQGIFRSAQDQFPDLIYYDVDIPLSLRYAAAYDVFMMAYCKVTAGADRKITDIQALDTPWDLEPRLPRLRKLSLRPDSDPSHAPPLSLIIRYEDTYIRAPLNRPRELLTLFNGILATYDPDMILTQFGDTWIFRHLQKLSKETGIPFNPNRDASQAIRWRKEATFRSYGRPHIIKEQAHLSGRLHIDSKNCMTYNHYQLIGAIEQVRFSSLPLQEVARRSPGAAIAAMQNLTAMRRETLVPFRRQKGEIAKTYNQLVRADRGGLVFQPPAGIFGDVAVLDFSSMMASVMVEYNVSPETVVALEAEEEGLEIPELGVKIIPQLGLIAEALRPMWQKRLALKQQLNMLKKDDPNRSAGNSRYKVIQAVTDALKWLTVVCYGRLGFANSVFGRVNCHEVVSFLSRKIITQARDVAEARGFRVLHLYVDSLFVSRPGATRADFQALAEEIERETRLPIVLKNTYPWFVFLASRENPNISLANCFFGAAEDGELMVRGLALRRGDTSNFTRDTQQQALKILAREPDPARLGRLLPEILEMVRKRLSALKNRQIPMADLVISQTLSRAPEEYSVLSSAAIVAKELKSHGKVLKMGEKARFIYVAPGPGVFAWDSPVRLDPGKIDVPKYKELLVRAVLQALQPLGVTEKILHEWLFSQAGYITPPGVLSSSDPTRLALPLLNDVKHLRVNLP
ncbi:MAG TPA: DNA polymerase domain-containing protein [Anaerolineales bacterium]|jgi:DNA polymerase-2